MYTFIWCFLTKLNDLPITFNLQEKVMMKIVKMTARKVVEWTTLPLRMTSIPLKVAFNNYLDPIQTPPPPLEQKKVDILPIFYTLSRDPVDLLLTSSPLHVHVFIECPLKMNVQTMIQPMMIVSPQKSILMPL